MSTLGSKAHNLIRLRDEFQLNVPRFEVFNFDQLFSDFKALKLDEEYLAVVDASLKAKGFKRVSFRTSAALEDGFGNSFAGQYETYLDVELSPETLRQHAILCFKSMQTERVRNYAKTQGVDFELGGSLIVQEMFMGQQAGALFSENGSGALAISYVDSWRNLVVEGESAHELKVDRHRVDSQKLPGFVRELCRAALQIESAIGVPVDIEWSFDGTRLAFLQFRPVTVPQRDYFLEWDSTNISENYPGVTLPLTYSVIRGLYAGVYPAFLRLLGTPEKVLEENTQVFENMLGYLDGHVYYRISSWYETLKLLPGKRNQEYFEAMLNPVKKRGENQSYARGLDARSMLTVLRFVWLLGRSERLSRKFRDHINDRITFYSSYKLDYLNVATVVNASTQIRAELLNQWAVPILNDVKLMVFHGILKTVFFKGDHQKEYLEFLQGLSDRASIKPLEGLASLGKQVDELMQNAKCESIAELRESKVWPQALAAVNEYNKHFGARTPDELKLENVRLTDSVTDLVELALKAAANDFQVSTHAKPMVWPAHISVLKRPLLRYVAENTRRAIDWRERFRFNRSQTFNMSRNAFDAIGRTLAAEGVIASERDVYWLTEHEIFEIVNGHAWSLNANELVAARKKQLATYEKSKVSLAVHGAGRIAALHLSNVEPNTKDGLGGNGVAPGELTAGVVVATKFDPQLDVRGKILVVHHIDPGWTLLFTQAAGIISERGNALSHAAIIAREIGIPCVVAAVGCTSALKTGDVISMNGITGSIEREKK